MRHLVAGQQAVLILSQLITLQEEIVELDARGNVRAQSRAGDKKAASHSSRESLGSAELR